MAASNSSRSRGVKIEQYWWGHWARGTREALIQHGITCESPFPGDPGEKKTTCKTADPLGREIRIQRASKTTFSVCRDLSEDEKELQNLREKREKEIQSAKKLVASWHKSPAAFRESANNSADVILGMLEAKLLDGESGGWRYDDATAHKIERLVNQIIELIKTGSIVEDIALKEKHTPACIADELLAARSQYGGNVVPFRPAQTV